MYQTVQKSFEVQELCLF